MPAWTKKASFRARISGQSIEKIARARRVGAVEVHAVLDRYCEHTLNPDVRRHGLAIELARLDRLLEAAGAAIRRV